MARTSPAPGSLARETLVTVTGRPESYRYTDANGQERVLQRFVVETFRFKSLKIRQEIP